MKYSWNLTQSGKKVSCEYKKYKIEYTKSSREDMKQIKKYILDTFQYREYGENYTKIMKRTIEPLKIFPMGFDTTGLHYRGYDIRMKNYRTYLLFFYDRVFIIY